MTQVPGCAHASSRGRLECRLGCWDDAATHCPHGRRPTWRRSSHVCSCRCSRKRAFDAARRPLCCQSAEQPTWIDRICTQAGCSRQGTCSVGGWSCVCGDLHVPTMCVQLDDTWQQAACQWVGLRRCVQRSNAAQRCHVAEPWRNLGRTMLDEPL